MRLFSNITWHQINPEISEAIFALSLQILGIPPIKNQIHFTSNEEHYSASENNNTMSSVALEEPCQVWDYNFMPENLHNKIGM